MAELAGSNLASVRRIVGLRAGALGDFVLTLPALAAMRRRFPAAQIDLIASRTAGLLAVTSGYVDRLIALDERWVASLFGDVLADEARAALGGVDLAVVWLSDPSAVAANLGMAGVPFVHVVPSFPPDDAPVHVADHLLATLKPLGIPLEPARPTIRLRDADRERAARALVDVGIDPRRPFATIHPGSGSRFKNWPAERFAALADHLAGRLGGGVLFLVGPADEETIERVVAVGRALPGHERIRVLRPSDATELAAVLAHATVHVGNDSGATHVAAAVGTPTVAIFGPTDPLRWAPRGPVVRVVSNPVECSPCSRSAMQACPHRNCLTRLDLATVLAAVERVLAMAGAGVLVGRA